MTQDRALEVLKSGVNVFLTGEPGAGKTHTINRFVEWLRAERQGYAITASTGIAATHIGGVTIHSWSGLGIADKVSDYLLQKLENDHFACKRIQSPSVLIIDEISMLDATFIDNLDKILRHMRGSEKPFGGIQVVFVGDFFQLPPVVKEGPTRFAFESEAWEAAAPAVCYLTEQHRQSDPLFLEILSSMRAGTSTKAHKARLLECTRAERPETRLFTHNNDVDHINNRELRRIKGEEHLYRMEESGNEFLVRRLKTSCLAPEKLTLKVGARVMFVRNNFDIGYVNGTVGVVESFDSDGLPVVLTTDDRRLTPVMEEWRVEEYGVVKAYIRQIPLRLAWAITVHKSQGMSLDAASVDLTRAFEHGQGYVAISRVRSLEGLHLEGMNEKTFSMHPKVVAKDAEFRAAGV